MNHCHTHAVALLARSTTHKAITVTRPTETLTLKINLEEFTLVEISEGKMNLMHLRWRLSASACGRRTRRWSTTHSKWTSMPHSRHARHTTTKHASKHGSDIERKATRMPFARATSPLLTRNLSRLVIEISLFIITQNIVGALNLLELLGITSLVRMMRLCQIEICLLDVTRLSSLIDSKNLIEFHSYCFSEL